MRLRSFARWTDECVRPYVSIGCARLLSMTQVSAHPKHFLSDKVEHFTESVVRRMTRPGMQYYPVNLAQGFPDFPAPAEIKRAAQEAIAADVNQYAITWGAKSLRTAIARQMQEAQGIEVDPEKEIVGCWGSPEAMTATVLAVANKGDGVVVFEPFYENYGPDSILSGAKPRFVSLRPPQASRGEWTFDEQELREAFQHKTSQHQTKAIIVNTPNNPTGKVFSRKELELIRDLCVEYNVLAITDEIYEHILYDGSEHISLARLNGMRERTITINGLSKSYSVTGWRVGWAGAAALSMPVSYYRELADRYRTRRDHLIPALEKAGFRCYLPRGAYYVMTDISAFGFGNDVEFAAYLVKTIGIACVPGSSFYKHPKDGSQQVRFAFCKKPETLDEAARRLKKLRPRL